jgi:hypothetical protein
VGEGIYPIREEMPVECRVRIELGDSLRLEFEGSEAYARDELYVLAERILKLRGALGERVSSQDEGSHETDRDSPEISTADSPVAGLAAELEVPQENIVAACSPSRDAPYLQLDRHFLAAFSENTPSRGPNAVPDSVLIATLLAFWFERANLDRPQYQQVLDTMRASNLSTPNARRGIDNCEWLQVRGDRVIIKPTDVRKAVAMAKAFCLKTKIDNG